MKTAGYAVDPALGTTKADSETVAALLQDATHIGPVGGP
jgi:hypothetical protein